MSRTRRKHLKDFNYDKEFIERMQRGLVSYGIKDPDDHFEETGNRQRAKKRRGRQRRLEAEKVIREQMDDLDL